MAVNTDKRESAKVSYGHLLVVAAALKASWALIVTLWLAAAEPFWHQAVLVLGGASITGLCVLGAAYITARRVEKPVTDIKKKIGADKREGDVKE